MVACMAEITDEHANPNLPKCIDADSHWDGCSQFVQVDSLDKIRDVYEHPTELTTSSTPNSQSFARLAKAGRFTPP